MAWLDSISQFLCINVLEDNIASFHKKFYNNYNNQEFF